VPGLVQACTNLPLPWQMSISSGNALFTCKWNQLKEL
jgi:hypothetical protein